MRTWENLWLRGTTGTRICGFGETRNRGSVGSKIQRISLLSEDKKNFVISPLPFTCCLESRINLSAYAKDSPAEDREFVDSLNRPNRESTRCRRDPWNRRAPKPSVLSILQEYRPRPLSFQRILNNGGASEANGKADRGGRHLTSFRGAGVRTAGPRNVVDANAALSKRGFLFSTWSRAHCRWMKRTPDVCIRATTISTVPRLSYPSVPIRQAASCV